jgi:predicted porin
MFNLGEISMKKSLVALAALAATTAFAQSSVTLYGRLDLGMSNNKNVTNAGTPGALDVSTKSFSLAGAQGTRTGGRLGVRGTEDLGGGLVAGFNIETRVNPDSSASTFGTTRNGNLSLTGGFGTVVIGTYLNALDDVRGYSVATASVAGGDFLAKTTGAAGQGLSGRSENSLGYRSPSFGGIVVRANIVNEKVNPGTLAQNVKGFGLAVGYDNGPLSALVAFGSGKQVDQPAGVGGKINDLGFGLSYNLGIAVPYFQFEQSKASAVPGPGSIKFRSFEAGAKFPLGAFTPYVSFSSGKETTDTGTASFTSDKARGFQIGTLYDISKRTYVYAAIGSDKSKQTAAPLATTNNTSKNTGYALGLVHSF